MVGFLCIDLDYAFAPRKKYFGLVRCGEGSKKKAPTITKDVKNSS